MRVWAAERGLHAAGTPEVVEALLRAPAGLPGVLGALPAELLPGTVPPWIALSSAATEARANLRQAVKSNPEAGDAITAETYILLRSCLVLLDAAAQHSDNLGPAWLAAKVGIPLWVVSDQVAHSPWLLAHADLVVRPSSIVDLLELSVTQWLR